MLFKMVFNNLIFTTSFINFYTINSTMNLIATSQTFQTIVYQNFTGSYQYTCLPSPLSLHQATSVVSMGCAVNLFMQCHLGDEVSLDMTASLFIQIPKLKGCKLLMWPKFKHFFLLYHEVLLILVLLYIGICGLVIKWMKICDCG